MRERYVVGKQKFLPLRNAWIKNSKAVAIAEFEEEQATQYAGESSSQTALPHTVCSRAVPRLRVLSLSLSLSLSRSLSLSARLFSPEVLRGRIPG